MAEQAIMRAFAFEGRTVRVDLFDGEPWWAARDVALSLGYAESSETHSLISKVPDKWKGRKPFATPGGVQDILSLSEQGLYFFLGRSDKPAALPFQEWIAGDVIPSIRRTGQYSIVQGDPTVLGLPDFFDPGDAAMAWGEQYKARKAAEGREKLLAAKIEEDAPLVDFGHKIGESKGTHLVGQVAKAIQQGTGTPMGQNRFFEWLREHRYLHQGGAQRNEPTQRCLDAGWMVLQVHAVEINGENRVTRTSKITGKGLAYFYRIFFEAAKAAGRNPLPDPPIKV